MPSCTGEFTSRCPHPGTHHMRGDLPVFAEFLRLHQLLWNSLASLEKENSEKINISIPGHGTSWLLQHLRSETGPLTFLRSVVSTVALS